MHSITWEDKEGVRWIQLEGDLDQEGVNQLAGQFEKAVSEGTGDVVVVMQGVGFMATPGISLLIKAHQTLKPRGRQLKLSGLQARIREVFKTMNLMELFEEV